MVEGLSITTRDLERWADHPEARHHLPRLIRRLLWASVNPRELDFSDDTDQRGFDGVCRVEVGSPFCPSGTSVWELSVRRDLVDKLNEDYKSRTRDVPQGSPDALVLVTPRTFLKKRDWVAERQKERRWREVRVLDGQDIAAWLEQCPAVAAWFAGHHLGHAVHDLIPVAEYLRRWSQATHPPVPPSLVLTERPREAAQIVDWLAGDPSHLYVQAATNEEARVFIAAVLAELTGPTGDRWSSRTLIVETPVAWRSLVQRAERPLVLIPNFTSDDLPDRGRHFACFPREQVPHGARAVSLAPIPWQEVARVLQSSGFIAEKAKRIASESRGHLSALRTLLGLPNLPPWSADPAVHTELAAMLLVGAWDPRVEGDRSTLRALGADPERLDELCNHLCQTTGRPLEIKDGAYVWTSQAAAWQGIHSLLTEKRLRSFGQVATAALGEDDPRYELPPDQRYVARLRGQHPLHSDVLRRYLANSLSFLADFNDPLRERMGRSIARQVVDDVVRATLIPAWKRWASLDDLMGVLAKAAPRVFLVCLRASLHSPDGVLRFFEEEGHPGLARATPHVPLLWALEMMAREPAMLADVADCLTILAEHDPAREKPAGRVANRPAASLAAIFHRITPQTLASDEQRFVVLAALAQRRPNVGFDLLIRILGQDLPSRRPPWLDERAPQEIVEPDPAQLESRSRRILDLLITTAGEDPDRWAELIRRSVDQVVDPSSASELVSALLSRKEKIRDPAASIWNEARHRLSSFRNMPERAPWAERSMERMRRVSDAFEPEDPWPVFLRKFKALVLPEGFSGGIVQQIEAQEAVRVQALDETPPGDVEQRVLALLPELEEPRELGRALARSVHAASFNEMLLEKRPDESWSRLVAPFAAGYYYTHGQDLAWLRTLFHRWMESERTGDIVASLLRIWAEPKIWDLVDTIGEPVKSRYWMQIERVGEHEGEQWDRACSELLAAGNLAVALECAEWQSAYISSENLLNTLERQDEETLHRIQQVAYSVANVFMELDRRVEEEQLDQILRIARLELRYVAVLRHVRDLRYVRALFESSPEFFADTVKILTADSDDTTKGQAASGAYEALSAWETYPGSASADPRVWEPILRSWAARALELVGDTEMGVIQVAEMLARPEGGEDGHWPCEAAREWIESGRYPGLAEQLISAKYNLRGVVTYDPMKGSGVQDRALAQDYRRSAAAIRTRWPVTAQGLDSLAELYEYQAEAAEEEARHERLAVGMSVASAIGVARLPRIETEHVGPATRMSLRCSERLNIITGDNSLGKTFFLDVAWWVLTGTWPEVGETGKEARTTNRRVAQPATERSQDARIRVYDKNDAFVAVASYRAKEEDWGRPATWPEVHSPVIYARVDGGYSAWDPLRSDAVLRAYQFSEHSLWNGLPGPDGKPACEGLLAHWRDWRLGDPERFDVLLRALKAMSPDATVTPGPDVKLHKHDDREMPTLRFPYGDVPFEHLSAGWKRILGLAYLLVWVWEGHREAAVREGVASSSGLVLLFDEAETHLHPRWQRRLLPALLAAAKGLPSGPTVQILVTTHSPMILASIEPDFDPECDTLNHLRLDEEQKVTLDELPWAKFGDASAWLESPLFGLARATSPAAEEALAAARALMIGKTSELPRDLATREQIHTALRRSLAETHPFWIRWSIFHDTQGNA